MAKCRTYISQISWIFYRVFPIDFHQKKFFLKKIFRNFFNIRIWSESYKILIRNFICKNIIPLFLIESCTKPKPCGYAIIIERIKTNKLVIAQCQNKSHNIYFYLFVSKIISGKYVYILKWNSWFCCVYITRYNNFLSLNSLNSYV